MCYNIYILSKPIGKAETERRGSIVDCLVAHKQLQLHNIYYIKLNNQEQHMILHSKIKFLLLMFLFSSTAQAIEIKSLSHAVDIAGKQRMFTQKMLKNYAMIGLNNRFGNPQADLNKTIISFENHMQSLYDFNKDESLLHVKICLYSSYLNRTWREFSLLSHH